MNGNAPQLPPTLKWQPRAIVAIVGEWVGSSAGLGHYMLLMNGRTKTAEMFAALLVLTVLAVALYFIVDAVLRRALPWQPDAPAA